MQLEPLSHLRLVQVTGDDAVSFLQGQLTQDIVNLPDNEWRFAAYCNAKGRAIALMQAWRSDEVIFLLIESSVVETALTQLKRYVLRSKVEFVESEEFTISGTKSFSDACEQLGIETDNAEQSFINKDGTFLLKTGERGLVLSPSPIEDQTEVSEPFWHAADIQDGFPRITAETSEAFVPQMLNLDLLGGINFKKGCYTGQEIVARMHYLGKLKQRMYLCRLVDSNQTPEVGEAVTNVDGKSLGNIVNATVENEYCLAVLRSDGSDGELVCAGGSKIERADPQPYSFQPAS